MPGLTKPQGRQQKKNASMYKLQFGLTDRNKKRKLRKHIRANPHDKKAVDRYAKDLGDPKGLGLSAKGRKRTAMALAGQTKTRFLRPSAVMALIKDSVGPTPAG